MSIHFSTSGSTCSCISTRHHPTHVMFVRVSPRELILNIIKAYQDARISRYGDAKILRGRSHSVSAVTEDLFASFLLRNDPAIDMIYVDQPMRFESVAKQIYPDIVIVKDGVITAFVDIKMDLGWKRDGLYDLCKKHQEIILRVKGVEAHLKDGRTKKSISLRTSQNVSYNVVIVSRTNIGAARLRNQLQQIESLKPDVDVFVLCDSRKPLNSYAIVEPGMLVDALELNPIEFERLKKKLYQS